MAEQNEPEHSASPSFPATPPGDTGPSSETTAGPETQDNGAPLPLPAGEAAPAGRIQLDYIEPDGPALPYPVVAFGSSAGGLQPFKDVLELLPSDTGMTFVLVPHLAAEQASYLREIAAHYTKMPVQSIVDGVTPQPNNLYILQPNETVQLRGGMFHIEPRDPLERVPRPIDIFFRSLSADQKNYAIGIVLSGADSDGALGLKTIKGEGGLTIVQAPETAQHSSMPRSSIAADHVDLVVPPAEIATELGRLAEQFIRHDLRPLEAGEEVPSDTQSLNRILQMLRVLSGLELRQYKPDTIRRRIARRMVLLRMDTLGDYVRYLQARKDELLNLQEDVLISVTRFFRDPGFWDSLKENLLPTFFAEKPAHRLIRIWCAGCSSGEEVYSIAMLLLEYLSAHRIDCGLQIFGTDASERSIDMARAGVYPESLAGEIGPERLRRFFDKVDRGYQVTKRVRDLCIFARQNLCTDPPFSHIDLLFCRNVLIYFNQGLQRQVMTTFHYALETSGYLLLGASESLREYDDAFAPVDRKNKIYRKAGGSPPGGYNLPFQPSLPASDLSRLQAFGGDQVWSRDHAWSELEVQRAADRIVLARFGPAGLIVDERLNVLQVRGQTSPYIELANGSVSWQLGRVLREGLTTPVREAVECAVSENVPVSRAAVLLQPDGAEVGVRVEVLPISAAGLATRCYLILFETISSSRERLSEQSLSRVLTGDDKDRILAQLRQDLSSTRFHLQSLIEERDARNQELVSANEEIQSANEELQSTNEELETTKEELQSTNEELQTVNDELQQRNAVLTQTGNDLTNLLTSVNIPVLMLTESLHIRQFTPPMERLLKLRASDIGRPLSDIRLQLSVEDIDPILQEVLESLGTREVEVQDREGRWYLMRVRPYRTSENKIEGLVVVLVDIDQLRRSQQDLRESRDFAHTVVESVPVPIVVISTDFVIRKVNTAFRDLTGMKTRELVGRSLPNTVQLLWGVDQFGLKLETLTRAEAGTLMEFEHQSTNADAKTLLIKGQALFTDGDRVLLLTMEDITLRRRAEHTTAEQKQALEREVAQTSQTLSRAQRELQELTAHLFSVQEEERRYVARELHDDVAQRLSALRIQAETAYSTPDPATRTLTMEQIRGHLDDLNNEVRRISHRLHPAILNDLGLEVALQALVEDFREREKMFATYMGMGVPRELSQNARTAAYRITQEALRNVAKHAGRTHVKVVLEGRGDMLHLEVRDFGHGFDADSDLPHPGLGIISMKERARIAQGTFEVSSALGEGTTVVFEVPARDAASTEAQDEDQAR